MHVDMYVDASRNRKCVHDVFCTKVLHNAVCSECTQLMNLLCMVFEI